MLDAPANPTFAIGAFGQPASAAAKFAAEGCNVAYLYESEGGATKLETWANAWLSAGCNLVLQDFAYDKLLSVVNLDRVVGIVPGPIGANGKPVYDEPERAGVTPLALSALANKLATSYPACPPVHMNFQGDRITSGPPNAAPVAGSTLVNRGQYPDWFAALDYAGGDWHVAARGYPVAHLVTMYERMAAWGAKRLYAMLECGPQTASDTPRTLTRAEILCQAMIAVAMNCQRAVWFVTREGHPTRGSFSFDPRNDEQKAGCVWVNGWLKDLDPTPVGQPEHIGAVMMKDPNTGLQVRDPGAGWIVRNVRRHQGALKTVAVNVSMTRTINLPDGTPLAPMAFQITAANPAYPQPPSPVDPGPVPPPPPSDADVIAQLRQDLAAAIRAEADAIRAEADAKNSLAIALANYAELKAAARGVVDATLARNDADAALNAALARVATAAK